MDSVVALWFERQRNDGVDAQEKMSGGSRCACLGFDAIQSRRRPGWIDGTPRRDDGAVENG